MVVGCQDLGGSGKLLFNEYRVSVREDEKILEMDGNVTESFT